MCQLFTLFVQVSGDPDNISNNSKKYSNENGFDDDNFDDDDENDYNEQLMEVQPDIIMHEDDDDQIEQFDSIVEEEGVDPIQEIEYQGVDPTKSQSSGYLVVVVMLILLTA